MLDNLMLLFFNHPIFSNRCFLITTFFLLELSSASGSLKPPCFTEVVSSADESFPDAEWFP